MPSATDRIDFGPPRDRGSIRAFVLALVAHLLLILALTWGVNWKTSDDASGALSAEIWTGTPDAAPRQVEAPTPTPTPPQPRAQPEPPPRQAQPQPQAPDPKVEIALEQEKKRKLLEQQRALEIKKLEKLKAELKAKEDQAKRLAAAEDAKKAEAKKADAKAADKAADKTKLAEAEAKKLREENMKRIAGMAGGSPTGDNKSQVGGGGSSRTYGAILRAAIKPNIVFTEEIEGNPMAKVEVRLQSDGTVISQRLTQSSGNKAWDDAAVNAIVRTRVMPRDVDGRLPDTILIIEMRPRG